MISVLKRQADFPGVVEAAGVHLKKRGTRHVGLCPFHAEKTPSFFIFDDNRFKCFGCGEHGDLIDFVRKMYGLSFQGALRHLGVERDKVSPEVKREIQKQKRKRQKSRAKKIRIADLQNTLLILISATKKAAKTFKTIDDLDRYGDILQPLPWWEYCLDLISFGTKEEQGFVCDQFKDEPVIPAKRFFKPGFDYVKWLKEFNEKRNAEDAWEINLHFERT